MLFLIACSTKPTVIIKTEYIRQKVPSELLEYAPLKKPVVKSQKDIINAYTTLFYYAKNLQTRLDQIKALNDQNLSQ